MLFIQTKEYIIPSKILNRQRNEVIGMFLRFLKQTYRFGLIILKIPNVLKHRRYIGIYKYVKQYHTQLT